jgi:hypothetical protein
MTEIESKRITTVLVAAYPAWKPSEATMQLYERLLSPLEAAVVEEAVLRIIRSPREFAPSVGTICREIARLTLDRCEPELSAEEAWAQVVAAVRCHGSYREPEFANPALARAVAAMQWGDLCTNSNVEASRAHFFRLFGAFQERRILNQVEQLSGKLALPKLAQESWPGSMPVKKHSEQARAKRTQGEFRWNRVS